MKAWIGAEAGRRLIEDRKSRRAGAAALDAVVGAGHFARATPRVATAVSAAGLVLLGVIGMMAVAGANSTEFSGGDRPSWYWTWVAGIGDVRGGRGGALLAGHVDRSGRAEFQARFRRGHRAGAGLPWIAIAVVVTVVNLLPREVQRTSY